MKTKEELQEAVQHHLGHESSHNNVIYYNVRPTPDGQNDDRNYDCPILSLVMKSEYNTHILYIAWRGSKTMAEYLTDADCRPTACDDFSNKNCCPNIRGHAGMVSIIHDNKVRLLSHLSDVIMKHRVKEVVFTGHSLGAGFAQLALMSTLGQKKGGFPGIEYEARMHLNKRFYP